MVDNATETTKVRRKRRSKGDISQLRMALWSTIQELEREIESDAIDVDDLVRLAGALATVGGVYMKVTHVDDLTTRIHELEAIIVEIIDRPREHWNLDEKLAQAGVLPDGSPNVE